jgi:hypothetical protein
MLTTLSFFLMWDYLHSILFKINVLSFKTFSKHKINIYIYTLILKCFNIFYNAPNLIDYIN